MHLVAVGQLALVDRNFTGEETYQMSSVDLKRVRS
jgi:hypothetical protein